MTNIRQTAALLADRGFERREATGDIFPAASVYMRFFQPLMPPACSPETKNFWQQMNTMSTGTRLETLMANT